MRRLILFAGLLGFVVACSGGGSPTSPSAPPLSSAPPLGATYTLSGHIDALQNGQPLGQVTINGTADHADGSYQLTTAGGTVALNLSGPGIVSRQVWVGLRGDRKLDLHPIALDGTVDLAFYREFVRGKLDNASLQPLRRLTAAPHVYLRTVDDAGHTITDATLDMVEATMRAVAPIWIGGQFEIAGFTRGTDTKAGDSGWLTVEWVPTLDHCGLTDVGTDGGVMRLNPSRSGCTCDSRYAVDPEVIRHELGHAFGYWHTDSAHDVMYQGTGQCGLEPSRREREAAKIAYSRPVGNTDPDNDPASAAKLTAASTP